MQFHGVMRQMGSRHMVTFVTQTNLLSAVIYSEDEQQRDEIENSKKVLAQTDVHSMAGDVVESCEDVDKASRVPATTWELP